MSEKTKSPKDSILIGSVSVFVVGMLLYSCCLLPQNNYANHAIWLLPLCVTVYAISLLAYSLYGRYLARQEEELEKQLREIVAGEVKDLGKRLSELEKSRLIFSQAEFDKIKETIKQISDTETLSVNQFREWVEVLQKVTVEAPP